MVYKADLHTHSTASDGQYAPAELVRLAKERLEKMEKAEKIARLSRVVRVAVALLKEEGGHV